MSKTPNPPRDPRYDSVKAMLTDRYNGMVPITDAAVQAVPDGLDEEEQR